MNKLMTIWLAAVAALFLAGCGQESREEAGAAMDNASEAMSRAADAADEAMESAGETAGEARC